MGTLRSKTSSITRKRAAARSLGLSTWKFKSPVITNGTAETISFSRSELNSSKKSVTENQFF